MTRVTWFEASGRLRIQGPGGFTELFDQDEQAAKAVARALGVPLVMGR